MSISSASWASYHKFYRFRKSDNARTDSKQFEPHCKFERHRTEERTAELDYQDLQNESTAYNEKHEFILQNVTENCTAAELTAIIGIEQLEQHKHRKEDGSHFRFGNT